MSDLSSDSVINVVHNSIKRGIRVALENECYSATVILVYSGIDNMAYLHMPEDRTRAGRKYFIDWCERYMKFPCKEQLTGLDLYGARCATCFTASPQIRTSVARGSVVRSGTCTNPPQRLHTILMSQRNLFSSVSNPLLRHSSEESILF